VRQARLKLICRSRGPARASVHGLHRTGFSWKPSGQDVQPAHAHKDSALLLGSYMLPSQMSRQGLVRTGDAPMLSLQPPGAQLSC
jgi:hypothetical protein